MIGDRIRRRRPLVVGLAALAVLVVAAALFVTRARGDGPLGAAPGSAVLPDSTPGGFGGSGRPSGASGSPGTAAPIATGAPTGPATGPTPRGGGPTPTPSADRIATPTDGPSPSTSALATDTLLKCDGPPGVGASVAVEGISAAGYRATITVVNTGNRRIRTWKVTVDNLTGLVSSLIGGLFHLVGGVFEGIGPLDVGGQGTIGFRVRGATGRPTACHVTVTF